MAQKPGPIFQIVGPSKLTYSSAPTRNASLQRFMGGAEGKETTPLMISVPGECNENLAARFGSRVCFTDMPKSWGYPAVDKTLAGKKMLLANDIASWRRKRGEPIY